MLRYWAEATPHNTVYTFLKDGNHEEEVLTFLQLHQRAQSVAAMLHQHVKPGDRVMICHHPGLEYLYAFFGCLYAGAVAVPVYPPRFTQKLDRLNSVVANAGPVVALTSKAILENLATLLPANPLLARLRWICTSTELPADQWIAPTLSTDSLAFLQYTSGSTSAPKGVMLGHGNVLANLESIRQLFGLNEKTIGMSWLPQYHDMGLVGMMLGGLNIGVPVVFMSPFVFAQRPYRWLHAISRYKATISGAPNFAFDLCAKRITDEQMEGLDLSSWELAFCGAEPISSEAIRSFTERFKSVGFRPESFYPCYGMAEAALIVSGGVKNTLPVLKKVDTSLLETEKRIAIAEEGAGSRTYIGCGKAADHHQIRVVDPETRTPKAEGEVGEIWFSGPSVAQGYWNLPEQTAHYFGAEIVGDTELKYLRTGDLGFFLDGDVYITGRIKDMMIIRGRNFYPQDIERTVGYGHPALKAGGGAAFSIDIGEEERLVVVQELERSFKDGDLGQIANTIRERIFEDHGVQPFAVALVRTNSVPLTSSGKIQRHMAKNQFLEGTLSEKYRYQEIDA
jgi:acyl-CoA synthetase (AMP-forming)/AMP-acid ligase II